MMARRVAALGLLAWFLSAAAPSFGDPAPFGHRIKTLAVIPALGGTFLFEHLKAKPFEWLGPPDSRFLETSDWGLDQMILQKATAALGSRYSVKPIAFDAANFSTWNERLLRRNTLDLNGDPAIDAYVLVLRDWRGDAIGHSIHDLGGLGLYRRDGRNRIYGVFACYRIVVVNALTGDVMASRPALLPNGGLPWLTVDSELWPRTPNDLTPRQRATLIADETRLIGQTLGPALKAIGLAR